MNDFIIKNLDHIYSVEKQLGRGGQGIVYLAQDENGSKVALKKIKFKDQESINDVIKEIKVLKNLSEKMCHPNILCYKRIFQNDGFVYLVTDYIGGNTFFETVQTIRKDHNDKDFHNIFLELCRSLLCTLDFIHNKGIVHADIKPENVLIRKVNESYQPVIIDFGLSCMTKDKSCEKVVGTLEFVAPEILTDKVIYPESDLWSLGIMLYEAYFGSTPWPKELLVSNKMLLLYITEGNYKFNIQTGNLLLNILLETLLHKDYRYRMSAKYLCDILNN